MNLKQRKKPTKITALEPGPAEANRQNQRDRYCALIFVLNLIILATEEDADKPVN